MNEQGNTPKLDALKADGWQITIATDDRVLCATDRYRQNLFIDWASRLIFASQSEAGSNAITFHQYYGHEVALPLPQSTTHDRLVEFLEEWANEIAVIGNAYESVFDGSNNVAKFPALDDNGAHELAELEDAFTNASNDGSLCGGMRYMSADDWYSGIAPDDLDADTTDEEVSEMADDVVETARSTPPDDIHEGVILDHGDTEEWLLECRDQMRDEQEEDTDD